MKVLRLKKKCALTKIKNSFRWQRQSLQTHLSNKTKRFDSSRKTENDLRLADPELVFENAISVQYIRQGRSERGG